MQRRVPELQEQSAFVFDSESKERALAGEVISTVALAGQICREFNLRDHGIDTGIEFRDDTGEAAGCGLYLQLNSGDSCLPERKRGGEIRWMEVRASAPKVPASAAAPGSATARISSWIVELTRD